MTIQNPIEWYNDNLRQLVVELVKLDAPALSVLKEDSLTVVLASMTTDKSKVGVIQLQKTNCDASEYGINLGYTDGGKYIINCYVPRIKQQEELTRQAINDAITDAMSAKHENVSLIDIIGDVVIDAFMRGYKHGKNLAIQDVEHILQTKTNLPANECAFAFDTDGDLLYGDDALALLTEEDETGNN